MLLKGQSISNYPGSVARHKVSWCTILTIYTGIFGRKTCFREIAVTALFFYVSRWIKKQNAQHKIFAVLCTYQIFIRPKDLGQKHA